MQLLILSVVDLLTSTLTLDLSLLQKEICSAAK